MKTYITYDTVYIILYLGNNLQAYEEGEQQQVKVLFLKDYSYKKINVIIFFFLFSAILCHTK